jgi:hypothetical protein
MAKFQQKPGSGSLFINSRKEKDSHPDYTGTLCGLDGKEYWLSCWQKADDANARGPIFTLSIKPKDAQAQGGQPSSRAVVPPRRPTQAAPAPAQADSPAPDASDDQVPF